ncbi:MAG: phage tail protein [Bacteroidota bacterium]|nr:phage tail protein [Bacteroidota bacterium]
MASQAYPPVSFHFKVEIQGFKGEIGFQSVDGLNAKIKMTPHMEGGENTFTHHLPDRIDYGDLTLKRGMLIGSSLIGWFNDAIQNFSFDPRDVTVTLMTAEHTPLEQWLFRNAWPKEWNIEGFDAMGGTKIATETIVLSYQYFTRVGLPASNQAQKPPTRV